MGDAADSRESGILVLVPKAHGVIRGRAPSVERWEIFFLGAPGGLCVSFLDCTDPRRVGVPKKMADR